MTIDTDNYYDVVVYDLEILAVVHVKGREPRVKRFTFPTWGGDELEDACKDISGTIRELRKLGFDDFRFHKAEDVSITNLNRVAERIATLVGATTEKPGKHLN